MPKLKEKGIIYKCVIIVIAVATDFSACFSVLRAAAAATPVTIIVAVAVVPTIMTTGLTGATAGAVATVSGLHV